MISKIPKWIGDLLEKSIGPNLTVLEIVKVTPSIKKIRFQGDISKMKFIPGGASVTRVSETEYRNYTIADYNIEKGIVEIIFHIHGNGIGSQYFDSLKIGDSALISEPRGRNQYNPEVKQHFIFGDETSLGLACSLFPILKQNQHQFQFYFELNEENINAPQILGLENYLVFPKDGSFRNEKEIHELPVFNTTDWLSANFILTGNAQSLQTFKKVLKQKITGKIYSQWYWLEGKKGL